MNLPLVRVATCGAMVGYLVLLGYAKWPERFGRGTVDVRVPRHEQLMVLAALALAGIMLGQIVRRVRRMSQEFALRVAARGANR
jgi:hypothetical protein